MGLPNPDPLDFESEFNAFKNNNVQRGNLNLPASLTANQVYTDTLSFTLSQPAAFLQAYMYNTDYQFYFEFLDSQYHDSWRLINSNSDNLVFSSGSLLPYYVRMLLNGSSVQFTLYLRGISSPVTINHPNHLVPITFIDYTLAN